MASKFSACLEAKERKCGEYNKLKRQTFLKQ